MTDDRTASVSTWRGQTRYACRFCAFDTLEEQKFVDHMIGAHPPLEVIEPEPTPARTPVPVTKLPKAAKE